MNNVDLLTSDARPVRSSCSRTRILLLSITVLFCFTVTPLLASPTITLTKTASSRRKTITDSKGFQWDLYLRYGMVNDGSNNAFDGAGRIYVNGDRFKTNNKKTNGKNQFLLTGSAGGVKVQRLLTVDQKHGALRFVEILTNPTSSKQQVNLRVDYELGRGSNKVVTNAGRVGLPLKKKEAGILIHQRNARHTPSILFVIRSKGSGMGNRNKKFSSNISVRSNDDVRTTYNLTIPPKKTVSVLHTLAQRKSSNVRGKKNVKKAFTPFLKRSWIKDVPDKIRKTILNAPGGFFFAGEPGGGFQNRLNALEVNRGEEDLLAMGDEALLRGSVASGTVSIETKYGTKSFKTEDVVAATGQSNGRSSDYLYLRDGQILKGTLSIKGLRFNSKAGPSMKLNRNMLDRLVLHETSKDGQPPAEVSAFVETLSGERIAVMNEEVKIPVSTPWGSLRVPIEDIHWIKRKVSDTFGSQLMLKNGTRLFCFLGSEPVELETRFFDTRTFSLANVMMVVSAEIASGRAKPDDLDQKIRKKTHAVFSGRNIFVGDLSADELKIRNRSGTYAVKTNRIRRIKKLEDTAGGRPRFQISLWAGGTLSGHPTTSSLSLRSAEHTLNVPVRDLERLNRPVRRIPSGLRNEIASLIRKLGHPSWKKRKKATDELKKIGTMALPQLREVANHAKDPEVKRRARKIIKEVE